MSTITPIKSVLATAPGTVLAGVRGVIKGVGQRNCGAKDTTAGPKAWSAQDIVLAGSDGAELLVTLWNKDAIAPESAGRHLYLLSAVVNGRTVGLKTDVQEGQPCLRVSAAAEMTFIEPGSAIPQPAPKPDYAGEQPKATATATKSPDVAATAAEESPAPSSPPTGTGTAAPPPVAHAPRHEPAADVVERAQQIMPLVRLYDECLTAVVMNVGKNLSDESGFLMAPEGTHFVAGKVFDQILTNKRVKEFDAVMAITQKAFKP